MTLLEWILGQVVPSSFGVSLLEIVSGRPNTNRRFSVE